MLRTFAAAGCLWLVIFQAAEATSFPVRDWQEGAAVPAAETAPQKLIPQNEAISIAQREVAGRVLSAQLLQNRGTPIYRVKILAAEGRVRTVDVNAQNGRIEN